MRVDQCEPWFTRLAVTVVDGRSVVVEVAHDARIREAGAAVVRPGAPPDEVAADKTLALFGRAAARDLVDMAPLSEQYTLEQAVRAGRREGRRFCLYRSVLMARTSPLANSAIARSYELRGADLGVEVLNQVLRYG